LGNTDDCANLTMLVLIDFAANNGLPVTFWHGSGCIFVSKSCKFSSKKGFIQKVQARIGAADPFGASGKTDNTGPDKKIEDVRPGDVYVESSHAALVVGVSPPAALSGGQQYYGNDDFEAYVDARKGVWTWNDHSPDENPDHLEWIYNPTSTEGYRVDYLNHTGSEKRKKAEIKYNMLYTDLSGKFRFWGNDVFRN
jgi:hypothetical protein